MKLSMCPENCNFDPDLEWSESTCEQCNIFNTTMIHPTLHAIIDGENAEVFARLGDYYTYRVTMSNGKPSTMSSHKSRIRFT